MADTNTTNSGGFLSSFAKGELPKLPVSLSFDSGTILSVAAIAIIITSIIIYFKYKK